MKKIHKLSLIGGIAGLLIIVCSIVRWFFLWYDPSQMIIGSAVGMIVCCFSYIYNWMRNKDIEMNKFEKRIDTFTNWWMKQEIK